jgi:hypothetical protein
MSKRKPKPKPGPDLLAEIEAVDLKAKQYIDRKTDVLKAQIGPGVPWASLRLEIAKNEDDIRAARRLLRAERQDRAA